MPSNFKSLREDLLAGVSNTKPDMLLLIDCFKPDGLMVADMDEATRCEKLAETL